MAYKRESTLFLFYVGLCKPSKESHSSRVQQFNRPRKALKPATRNVLVQKQDQEREISRPTPLKIATETMPSKLDTVFSDFSDDRARCFAITVFMSRSISVNAIACHDKSANSFPDDCRFPENGFFSRPCPPARGLTRPHSSENGYWPVSTSSGLIC
jgi:hypothetical protein